MNKDNAVELVEESLESYNIPNAEVKSANRIVIKSEYNGHENSTAIQYKVIDEPDLRLRIGAALSQLEQWANTQRYIEKEFDNE